MGISLSQPCNFSTKEVKDLQAGQVLIAKALIELLAGADPVEETVKKQLRQDLTDHFKPYASSS